MQLFLAEYSKEQAQQSENANKYKKSKGAFGKIRMPLLTVQGDAHSTGEAINHSGGVNIKPACNFKLYIV